jgi:membrane-bound lytic murein transglycosylase B
VTTLTRFRRARAAAVAAAAAAVASSVLGVAPTARADTTGAAQARAQALLAKVHALQAKVRAAERAYERVLQGVAQSVTDAVESDRAAVQVRQEVSSQTGSFDSGVRGLYMSGGPLALYATLLQSGDITDFQDRAAMVGRVFAADTQLLQADARVIQQADDRARSAHRRAHLHILTERNVAAVAARVETLLAQEQTLLAQADAQVAHLKAVAAARAALAAASTAFGSITSDELAQLHVLPPSATYLSLYKRAATTCAGLSWTVLAAIGQVESGHGRNPSMSSAGALGPMQFLPSTFASYGVDGDHDGRLSIMDPADAIFTAARYLCANGAGRSAGATAGAIWHYNHADWYVQMVLTLAKQYAGWTG